MSVFLVFIPLFLPGISLLSDRKHDRGDSGIPQDANFSTDTMALYEFGGNIGKMSIRFLTLHLVLVRFRTFLKRKLSRQ